MFAEKYPPRQHESQGQNAGKSIPPKLNEAMRLEGGERVPMLPGPMNRQGDAVQPPPKHEIPTGAMPQPAQEHGHEQVDVGPPLAFPAAAQWNIKVVAEPARKRDM